MRSPTTIHLGCDSFSRPTMTPCSGGVVMGGMHVTSSRRAVSSVLRVEKPPTLTGLFKKKARGYSRPKGMSRPLEAAPSAFYITSS